LELAERRRLGQATLLRPGQAVRPQRWHPAPPRCRNEPGQDPGQRRTTVDEAQWSARAGTESQAARPPAGPPIPRWRSSPAGTVPIAAAPTQAERKNPTPAE